MGIGRLTTSSTQAGFPKYNKLWDGTTAVGAMEAISSITLSGSQSTVEFNNIPQTYTHLQIRMLASSARSGYPTDDFNYWFNGNNSGTSYALHTLNAGIGATATANAGGGGDQSVMYLQWCSSTYSYSAYTAAILDILDYTNTNKYKTTKAFSGYDLNANVSYGGTVGLHSGLYKSTNAITSITMSPASAAWAANSTFSLYGIK